MEKIQAKRITLATLTIITFLFVSCTREWVNPLDDASGIDWAPMYLETRALSADSVMLQWVKTYNGINEFVLDKKINDQEWIEKYATISPVNTYFIDDSMDTKNNVYSYRVYSDLRGNYSENTEVTYSFACGFDSLTDSRDGNKYATIQIGNQCWMAENLKFLPIVFPPDQSWSNLARYFVYDYYDSINSEARETLNFKTYGVLYNWTAAKNACPEGWTLPDFEFLTMYSGGECCAGKILKERDTIHWHSPNTGANEDFGFLALPGGCLNDTTEFQDLTYRSYFWNYSGDYYVLYYDSIKINRFNIRGYPAFSLRCVKVNYNID
jgi:uncharacterized protein (TIGR02145 family)